MLQIDLIYEFLNQSLFSKASIRTGFCVIGPDYGELNPANVVRVFINDPTRRQKIILFVEQEPYFQDVVDKFLEYSAKKEFSSMTYEEASEWFIIGVGEKSHAVRKLDNHTMYYFYHGFAALDWYRGYHALNYTKKFSTDPNDYHWDFVSFNRLVRNDRSYRCYFVARLVEENIAGRNLVSFGVSGQDWKDEIHDPYTKLSEHARDVCWKNLPDGPLVIDAEEVPGYASADIPRMIEGALWHVVTETVFYYKKLHLTEKIFKPIVMKQPFLLLAAPGNLAYLRSYGFKTFDGIIDESYDDIIDNEERVDAVVAELVRLSTLSENEKRQNLIELEKIVEHNFKWFYGGFREKIAQELLDNAHELFVKIGHDDSDVPYLDLFEALTT